MFSWLYAFAQMFTAIFRREHIDSIKIKHYVSMFYLNK